MGLEWIDLFSVEGFSFFLLILAIGYYVIEVVFGKYYIFRYIFREYTNNLFDRALHYVIWGMFVNILFISFFYKMGATTSMVETFNAFWKFADGFAMGSLSSNSLQLIIFGSYYFFVLILILSVIAFCIHVIPRITERISPFLLAKTDALNSTKEKK